jgi:hypothetical protein
LRATVLCFVWASLFAAGVAGFFGAMINKNAPVEGGSTIHLIPIHVIPIHVIHGEPR